MTALPPITEKDFSRVVEDLLTTFGWRWMHIRPARVLRKGKEIYETPYSGHKGFVDYLAVRRGVLVLFEIKSEKGELTPEQKEWIDDLGAVAEHSLGVFVGVWKPSDFDKAVAILK